MKPNIKQKELINMIASQLDFWLHTNDITSPTHLTDLEEEFNKNFLFSGISSNILDDVKKHLEDLYHIIRKLDETPE